MTKPDYVPSSSSDSSKPAMLTWGFPATSSSSSSSSTTATAALRLGGPSSSLSLCGAALRELGVATGAERAGVGAAEAGAAVRGILRTGPGDMLSSLSSLATTGYCNGQNT